MRCGHRTLQFVEIRAQFVGVDDHIDPRSEVIYKGFSSTGKADKMSAENIIKTLNFVGSTLIYGRQKTTYKKSGIGKSTPDKTLFKQVEQGVFRNLFGFA